MRLDVEVPGEPASVLVTLTRADASGKALVEGTPVWLLPVPGASRVAVSGTVPVAAEEDLVSPGV